MNDSQNDDESDLGKPVAGLGCYIGVRGLIMLILLMFIVVSSGTIIVLLTSLSPNVAEYRIWINGTASYDLPAEWMDSKDSS